MSSLSNFLKSSELFNGLDPSRIEQFSHLFEQVDFRKGDAIFREGEHGDSMYILGEGEVAVRKRMGQGSRELRRMGPGEHFGEMALIADTPRAATCVCLSDAVCARMNEEGFASLMNADAHFAQRMLHVLTHRLIYSGEMATQELLRAHEALMFSLAHLADSRDPETGAHLYRVRDYCVHLSELLAASSKFRDFISDSFVDAMYLVSPLHDIGKVAIPDGILLKEGRLTEAEFSIMATHTTIGAKALDAVLQRCCDYEAFYMAKRVILHHHERWDGRGYPDKLKGEEIPLEARIMTLADTYDALLSRRVYKPPFDYDNVREKLTAGAGTHFDPDMTAIMLEHIEDFEAIHQSYAEEEPELVR